MSPQPKAVRIDDPLWSAALAKARTEGKTLSDVIREALRAYTAPRARYPEPPPPDVDESLITTIERSAPGHKRPRPRAVRADDCPHPKARVLKGLCGACGTFVGGGK